MAAGNVEIDVNLDVDRLYQGLERVRKSMDSLGDDIDRASKRFDLLASSGMSAARALTALGPAIVPIGAAAVGAVGALASSFAAAGAGAAAFGAVAVGVLGKAFKASEEYRKINEDIAKAQAAGDWKKVNDLIKERSTLMAGLTAEQRKAATALNTFKSFWDGFVKQFETPVVNLFVRSLDGLQGLLTALKPAINSAAEGFNTLMTSMEQAGKAQDVKAFFNWLGKNAGPNIVMFGKVAGNIMRGLMNIFMAFTPLSDSMGASLLTLSQRFLKWTQSLQGSQGFQQFVTFVQTNGPKVWGVLSQLGQILMRLAIIMAPIGAVVLDLALRFLQWVNSMMQAHPQAVAFMIVGAQIGAILLGLIGVITRVVSVFNTFRNAFNVLKTGFTTIQPFITQFRARLLVAGQRAMTTATTIMTSFGRMAAAAARGAARMVAAMGRIIARYAILAARALMSAARVALSWIIAMGPVGWVIAIVVALVLLIIANWDKVKAWTIKAWNAAAKAVSDGWKKIKTWVKEGIEAVKKAVSDGVNKVKSFASDFVSAGKDLIMGLVDGIKSVAGRVVDAALGAAKDAVNAVKDWLGISSPAKMTIEMGGDFGEGFAIGISDMIRESQKASRALAQESFNAAKTRAGIGTGGLPSQSQPRMVTNNVTVNATGATLTERKLIQLLRQREWFYA
jgi:hypothetical protein